MHKFSVRCDFWFARPLSPSEQNELTDKMIILIQDHVGLGGVLEVEDADIVDLEVGAVDE